MDDLANQLITVGIGEALLGFAYLLWFVTGVTNAAVNTKTWSWRKTFVDLSKAILMAIVILGLVMLSNGLQWFADGLGFDITPFTNGMSTVTILGGIIGGTALYYSRAVKNAINFFKLSSSVAQLKEGVDTPNYNAIAEPFKEFIGNIYESMMTQHDSEGDTGATVIPEMGATTYYKVDVSTPQLACQNLLGKGFNEGWGLQCVAGFKEFMFSMFGKYVAAGGAAANYASEPAISNVCALGFEWHSGSAGLQDGDWGIWTNGLYGHVAMYYQGKWLGQNQGAADGNIGNAFNLMGLPMTGFAGYFRPKKYLKSGTTSTSTKTEQVEKKEEPKQESKQEQSAFKVGDRVVPTRKVDYDGRNLRQYDDSYTITQINGDRAVLSARGQVWAAMRVDDIRKV